MEYSLDMDCILGAKSKRSSTLAPLCFHAFGKTLTSSSVICNGILASEIFLTNTPPYQD